MINPNATSSHVSVLNPNTHDHHHHHHHTTSSWKIDKSGLRPTSNDQLPAFPLYEPIAKEMAAARGSMTLFGVRLLPKDDVEILKCHNGLILDVTRKKRRVLAVKCGCSQILESDKRPHCRGLAPIMLFAHRRSQTVPIHKKYFRRCTARDSGPQSRDSPPKRDTGIANERDWGIVLNDSGNESGTNEDGSTWYLENGEDLGDNGYRCRWTKMGGKNVDGTSEWKEAWWEQSDWTGYKELAVEKSGSHGEGDSWWETWRESLHQDEWSNLARIEKSAQKQAKSGKENAGWYENWWEKYDAKGSTEKGAHKYGKLNEQSWWERWGEHFDGRGSILKWTDKWAETDLGTKWGDKWEERFFHGIGSRKGETWHVSPGGERWSRTWGEEHFGNGKVHKYGKSTTGESWDTIVYEETYYEAEPHYGWADVVGDSSQLLSIQPRERPTGVFPNLEPPLPSLE